MNKYNAGEYHRISKRKARNLFNDGKTIYICPANFRPDNLFMPAIPINNTAENDFDKVVNAYEYYNCGYPDTWEYAAYYEKEETCG